MRTIARLYDGYADAASVVNELEASGIDHSNISLVANADAHGRHAATATGPVTGGGTSAVDPADPDDSDSGAGTKRGAVAGTLLGGGAGLLAGIGALAIPGIGPLVAAGWLVATLAGAAAGAAGGGLIGALTGAGVSHEEANAYDEGVKRGGTLVTVRVEDADVSRVESIMQQRSPVDWRARTADLGALPATGATTTGATTYPDGRRDATREPIEPLTRVPPASGTV
jgi:hypothetical protein